MMTQVDKQNGIIHGVTVMESGVFAQGHFLWVDGNGMEVPEGTPRAKKIKLATDDRTIASVMDVLKADGRARTRVNHSDLIQDRAGYSEGFEIEGNKLICDVNLFDSFQSRNLILETADKTPDLIGLSIDFNYTTEIAGDTGYLRAYKVNAVDIVDKGAVTPRGLFSVIQLGARNNKETENMANAKMEAAPAKVEPVAGPDMAGIMAQLADICGKMGGYVAKMEAAANPPAEEKKEPAGAEETKPAGEPHTEPDGDELKASVKALTEDVKKLRAEAIEQRKTFSALGVKPEAAPKPSSDSASEPVKATDKAPEAVTATAQFKAKIQENKAKKMSASVATQTAMHENKELYAASLKERGIIV